MIKIIKTISILLCILSINCVYVYTNYNRNAFLDPIEIKEGSSQPMAFFCMGGSSNKFTYIRSKPYSTSFLDTVNLFKFFDKNRCKDFHFGEFEHSDYGTPQGRLPIRIIDTSILDIDSTIYGKNISNCSTIYFKLKKVGRTEMIVNMGKMKKDTISLLVDNDGLSAKKNRKKRTGKTRWLGIITLKD